ncbi:MAG: hypothetical protein QOK44_5935 [Betaproteobacteria bacterium]|jgi:CheY-like chemotaxis protein|nr:hypothetical protein [Betaproteobacteria bacterium]
MLELSVLVIEDQDLQQEMIVEMVRRLNTKDVYSAADSKTALEVVSSSSVDVIMYDIDMPAIDGLEFMRQLSEGGVRSSVIIASSIPPQLLAATEAMTRSYGIDLRGVIQKPITQAALETLLVRPAARPRKAELGPAAFTVGDIMDGLQQDQFEPFFQPRVELATRRVVGAEALARWCHPQQGVIPPSAFVRLLEEAGKIDDLMWVMLQKGVALCAALKAAGVDSLIAVKLSLKSLSNAELAERVTEIVEAGRVEPAKICFEIAESAATTDDRAALQNLARLPQKGFLLSIDDFGTGHATLNSSSAFHSPS